MKNEMSPTKPHNSNKTYEMNEEVNQPLTKNTSQSKRRQIEQPTTSASQSLRSTSKKRGLEKVNNLGKSDEILATQP